MPDTPGTDTPGADTPGADTPGADTPGADPLRAGPMPPAEAIEAALAELELTYDNPRPGAYLVQLEGTHKLATMAWLIVGEHSLSVDAFFCRQPDENHAAFYRWMLELNRSMYGVH